MYNLDTNFSELYKLINNRTEDNVLENFNVKMLIKYQQEELRLISNFLSSAYTLKEFIRCNIKKFGFTDDFIEEYNDKIKVTFANSSLVQLVEACRNVLVHEGIPCSASSSIHFNKDEPITYSLTIKSEDLLKSRFFNNKGKNYCDTHKTINLAEVCFEYYSIIKDFYKWFNESF